MAEVTYTIILVIFMALGDSFAQRKAKEMCSEFVGQGREDDISGGQRSKENEFPHMVALGFGNEKQLSWMCGGSLISDQFVLTAAHCTHLSTIGPVKIARLGTKSFNPRRHQNPKNVKIVQIINHSDYKSPSSYNDIALLKLEQRVQFSRNVLPACLNTASNINLATNTLVALGWGEIDFSGPTSDDFVQARLRIVQNRECNRSYRRSSRMRLPSGVKGEKQFCALGNFEEDTCQGDSGSPLEYKNGRFHYIVGVTSFGKACGASRAPGIYTRVSNFVPWIESIVWP